MKKCMNKFLTILAAAVMTVSSSAALPISAQAADSEASSYSVSASKNISSCTAKLSATSYIYTGSAKKPTVTVKYGSTTLKKNTDYTVTYSNNVNVGAAVVTIKGKGSYTGTKKLTFTIKALSTPAAPALTAASSTSIKAAWKKVSYAGGYILQRYNSSTKKYTNVKTTASLSYTQTGLTEGKTYKYRICAYRKIGSVTYKTYSSAVSKATLTQAQEYQQEVLRLINIERTNNGLSQLKSNSVLESLAAKRAVQIKTQFSHTYNGKNAGAMLTELGYSWTAWGENIAAGQKTPEQVVQSWMNSSGHRANILNKNYKQVGIGYNGRYWVQIFTN